MTTITIKINERTKVGKALMTLIETFSKEEKGVEIISDDTYNPEFVKKVLNSHKNDKRIAIETEKLWESI